MEEGKNISDYAYYQHTDNIVGGITNPLDEWAYCSPTALAQCLMFYQNDKNIIPEKYMDEFNAGFNWGNGVDVDTDGENIGKKIGVRAIGGEVIDPDTYINTYASTIVGTEELDDYVSEIADSLKVNRPVIICVYHYSTSENKNTGEVTFSGDSTHFVTVVGVKSGVDLDSAKLSDFVIFDPGTNQGRELTTMDNPYTGYEYYPYNYRIITPYLYDSEPEVKDFILDENDKKTTDPYYLDPVKKSDDTIFPAEIGNTIKEIIASVVGTSLPDHEKERIIAQMVKVFTGESDFVYEDLTISENGEYAPGDNIRWNRVTVNVPDRYDEGYSDGMDAVADDVTTSGGGAVFVPDSNGDGGGNYSYPDGAVPGVSVITAGKVAVKFAQADGEAFITDPVRGLYVRCAIYYDGGWNEWIPCLELYDARSGNKILWAACSVMRDEHGRGGDDVRIYDIEIRPGDRIILRWRKYNPLPGSTAKTEDWAMIYLQPWMFSNACIASGSAPVYIVNN